jgi:hypothetical protein
MPDTRVRPVSRAAELLDEHRRLHAHLQTLEAALSAPPALEARAAWAAELASSLATMRLLLQPHFAREEEPGGLFDEIQVALPGAAHACEQLRAEHAGLLDRVERLAAGVQTAIPPEALRPLLADGLSLCHDLVRHEERENELLLRALEDETPAQD